jgi:hypothetical protein
MSNYVIFSQEIVISKQVVIKIILLKVSTTKSNKYNVTITCYLKRPKDINKG